MQEYSTIANIVSTPLQLNVFLNHPCIPLLAEPSYDNSGNDTHAPETNGSLIRLSEGLVGHSWREMSILGVQGTTLLSSYIIVLQVCNKEIPPDSDDES